MDSTIVNVRFVNDQPTADAGTEQNVDEETTVTLARIFHESPTATAKLGTHLRD